MTAYVGPAITGKALLQRWTGKTWTSVTWLPYSRGTGSKNFHAPARGYYAYRLVVPATTFQGRQIAAGISSKFYLSVR